MNINNSFGFEKFVWWVGVIEDIVDPLTLGRCRIRIFGYHSDKSKVPTKDLPWAHPIFPLNNSKSFSSPDVGEWVVGFFMDGEAGQQPVMFGVLPGIKK